MIVPSTRLLWGTGLVILPLATAGGLEPSLRLAAGGLIAVALAVAVADALLAQRALSGLTATLPDVVRLFRRRKGSIDIRITHDGLRPRRLRVGLALPSEIASEAADVWTTLPAGVPVCRIACDCTAVKRGAYLLDKIYLEGASPLGLWSTRTVRPASCEIRVYPDLIREGKRVAAQFLNRGGVGVHRQRQVGRGREFEKLREYSPGDDYSEIHWKATARRSRPVTKVFQVERTQEVYVIVDASRLTARPAGADDTMLE